MAENRELTIFANLFKFYHYETPENNRHYSAECPVLRYYDLAFCSQFHPAPIYRKFVQGISLCDSFAGVIVCQLFPALSEDLQKVFVRYLLFGSGFHRFSGCCH